MHYYYNFYRNNPLRHLYRFSFSYLLLFIIFIFILLLLFLFFLFLFFQLLLLLLFLFLLFLLLFLLLLLLLFFLFLLLLFLLFPCFLSSNLLSIHSGPFQFPNLQILILYRPLFHHLFPLFLHPIYVISAIKMST